MLYVNLIRKKPDFFGLFDVILKFYRPTNSAAAFAVYRKIIR